MLMLVCFTFRLPSLPKILQTLFKDVFSHSLERIRGF